MYSKFLNLNKEKQERILNAAMKEFSTKGYDKASTNEIVKEAEISKGILFHYFKNKKQLFLFLYEHCIEIVMNSFYEKCDLEERDFFVKLRNIQIIKMELLKIYPDLFKFLEVAYMEQAPSVKLEVKSKNEELKNSSLEKVFKEVDVTKFKDGLDISKVIKTIIWTFEGFADEFMKKSKISSKEEVHYGKAFEEIDEYIEMFKKCFYK